MSEPSEGWTLACSLKRSIRRYQWHRARRGPWSFFMRKVARLERNFFSILTASDIGVNARFGRNLSLPHPTGVVIHGESVIGDDCMIMQQVTIGQLAEPWAPRIGSHVYIGAGAKVLGRITIGDHARIGANAVVLCDVPPGATAVGVPARIIGGSAALEGEGSSTGQAGFS